MIHDAIVAQAVIDTERLTLRPLRKSDAGLMQHYGGEDRVARMTRTIPHPLPPGAIEAYIETVSSTNRDEDAWALDGSKSGRSELMGVISIERMDRNQSEISYWVAPAYWNSGLASEAVRGILDANPRDNDTMFASVFQDNAASARVLTNAGFTYIGDAEAFAVARGATVPTWTYHRKMR